MYKVVVIRMQGVEVVRERFEFASRVDAMNHAKTIAGDDTWVSVEGPDLEWEGGNEEVLMDLVDMDEPEDRTMVLMTHCYSVQWGRVKEVTKVFPLDPDFTEAQVEYIARVSAHRLSGIIGGFVWVHVLGGYDIMVEAGDESIYARYHDQENNWDEN